MKAEYRFGVWLYLRILGLSYAAAFLSLAPQIVGLYGSQGILPLGVILPEVEAGSAWSEPSLLSGAHSDGWLHAWCWIGMVAGVAAALGVVEGPALLVAWAIYLSIVNVGFVFMWFQWDSLLLEAGFLGLLVARWTTLWRGWGERPPDAGVWLLRWLLFRLMFGSAWAKWASGDATWRDGTALTFHFETQPLPTPLAWWAHHMPDGMLQAGTAAMFAIQWGGALALFGPVLWRRWGTASLAGLQLAIALTGNYGFFNLLSLGLCVAQWDDSAWSWLRRQGRRWIKRGGTSEPVDNGMSGHPQSFGWRDPRAALAAFLVVLSVVQYVQVPGLGAVQRSLSGWHLTGRYGLFANMTQTRSEIVVWGSDNGVDWTPLSFRWKPGPLDRPPPWVAPHMPRLDWMMWFAALGDHRSNPWFARFEVRLMEGSQAVWSLLAEPWSGRSPGPRYVKAVIYPYEFADWDEAGPAWWRRGEGRPFGPALKRSEP